MAISYPSKEFETILLRNLDYSWSWNLTKTHVGHNYIWRQLLMSSFLAFFDYTLYCSQTKSLLMTLFSPRFCLVFNLDFFWKLLLMHCTIVAIKNMGGSREYFPTNRILRKQHKDFISPSTFNFLPTFFLPGLVVNPISFNTVAMSLVFSPQLFGTLLWHRWWTFILHAKVKHFKVIYTTH